MKFVSLRIIEHEITAVRGQRMSHKSDNTFLHFISSISGLDSQATIHERESEVDLMSLSDLLLFAAMCRRLCQLRPVCLTRPCFTRVRDHMHDCALVFSKSSSSTAFVGLEFYKTSSAESTSNPSAFRAHRRNNRSTAKWYSWDRKYWPDRKNHARRVTPHQKKLLHPLTTI